MHLLIFIHSMRDGGAERVSANLANYWAGKGWQVTLVTLVSKDDDVYELSPLINRISLNSADVSSNALAGLVNNIRRVIRLRQILRQIQPDLAMGMMTTANVLLAMAAWGVSIHTVGVEHIHPPRLPMGFLWETLRRYTYGLLNVVTALASEGEEWIKSNTNAKKVLVIPNSVHWPLTTEDPQINPNTTYPLDKKLLLAVGRLNTQKGFDWLIEGFYSLAHKHPNWVLVILGEGSLRPLLEKQVFESKLENCIFLPGRAGNINEWYEKANLFVMSSRFEGFPMTLVEAMAYGLPAVSFDCDTGPRDIIRHEVDGLLVRPGNVAELTAALDRLMSDDLLIERFSERAVEVRERFSRERIVAMWEKLFEDVLHENK